MNPLLLLLLLGGGLAVFAGGGSSGGSLGSLPNMFYLRPSLSTLNREMTKLSEFLSGRDSTRRIIFGVTDEGERLARSALSALAQQNPDVTFVVLNMSIVRSDPKVVVIVPPEGLVVFDDLSGTQTVIAKDLTPAYFATQLPKLGETAIDALKRGSAGRAASRVRRGRPLDAIIHVRR